MSSTFKLGVERLGESPKPHHFEIDEAWWRERMGGDGELAGSLREALRVEIIAYKMGEDVYLEGSAQGALELSCSRCLTRYRHPIRERFRLVLEPAGSRVPADPEGAEWLASTGVYLSDELESGWFRGSEIELDRFVQEVIALGCPVQPLCREDCKGLCPRCGIERNSASCDCREARPESPFAVLRKLRDPQSQPESDSES